MDDGFQFPAALRAAGELHEAALPQGPEDGAQTLQPQQEVPQTAPDPRAQAEVRKSWKSKKTPEKSEFGAKISSRRMDLGMGQAQGAVCL